MPGSHVIECPHCGAESVVLAGAANKRWMCDACGGLIDLREASETSAEPKRTDGAAAPDKPRASRWMEGLTPDQQEAIRAELAANPEILRNELARVRRETAEKVMGKGARSPLLRLIGGIVVLGGAFTAGQPFAGRLLNRMGDDFAMAGAEGATGMVPISIPIAILLGISLMAAGAALAFGRRWGAHSSAILLVFACFVYQFHAGVVAFALCMIMGLFLTRRALE